MTERDQGAWTSAPAQVRAITHLRRLADLLDRRPDLEGVHAPADLYAEALRWSV